MFSPPWSASSLKEYRGETWPRPHDLGGGPGGLSPLRSALPLRQPRGRTVPVEPGPSALSRDALRVGVLRFSRITSRVYRGGFPESVLQTSLSGSARVAFLCSKRGCGLHSILHRKRAGHQPIFSRYFCSNGTPTPQPRIDEALEWEDRKIVDREQIVSVFGGDSGESGPGDDATETGRGVGLHRPLRCILARRAVQRWGSLDLNDYGERADYRSPSVECVLEVSGTEDVSELGRRHREKVAQVLDNI